MAKQNYGLGERWFDALGPLFVEELEQCFKGVFVTVSLEGFKIKKVGKGEKERHFSRWNVDISV